MAYEPLHHKYRPQSLAQLVGQEAIAQTLTNAINSRRIAPAYLFTGPRGTGKTSSARILAKSLNCLTSEVPTAQPCGKCDVCLGITQGRTLDVIEIDAASNTGVDNIRDLIEKAQFAPAQCRYKVYVIDECLTGDSLVKTDVGFMRIDDPQIEGQKVLSYNETTTEWEYKKVVRWLDQGEREIFVIKTNNSQIRCTGNHLLRTEKGWIEAKNLQIGMRILSPVNVDVATSFTNMEQMVKSEDSQEVINSTEIPSAKNFMTCQPFWNKQEIFNHSVPVDVTKNSMYLNSYNKKAKELKVFNTIGQNIPIEKDMDCGKKEQVTCLLTLQDYQSNKLGSSTGLYLEMVPLATPTKIADFPDWHGHTEKSNKNGWNIKPLNYFNYNLSCESAQTKDMENYPFVAIQSVIPNYKKSSILSNRKSTKNLSLLTGLNKSVQREWLGGTWMMDHLLLARQEAPESAFLQKDIPIEKIKLLPNGSDQKDTTQLYNPIKLTTTLSSTLKVQENGWQILNSIPSHQWITSLETVVSVQVAGLANVYDIEVADNHNFVANGLLVHNCHMLSVAAFNSLLKTLEEPPEHVVFVLATTDPQRVLPTIISRCQRFDFRRIPLEAMVKHLRYIADQEQINITDESIYLVAQIAQGGLRDAESLLDQLSLLPDQIGAEQVWDLVGTVPERDLVGLLEAIAGDQPTQLLERTRQIMDRGREPLIVLQNLAGFYRDLLIAKTAPDRSNLVALTQPTWEHLCKFVQDYDLGNILAGQKHLQESEVQIKNTTQPRLWLEVTLLGLLPSAIQQKLTVIASPAPNNIPSNPPTAQQGRSPAPFDPSPPNHQVNQANNNQVNNQVNQNDHNPPAATPTPISTPAPSPVYELSTSADMTEIWERVLSLVQPNATQQLYRQQVSLLTFDGQLAVIAVRSKPIYGLVATKITNLEKAFEVLFNKTIKVKLQISNGSKSQVNSHPPVNSTNQNNSVNSHVNNINHSINSPAPTVEQPANPIDPNNPQAVDQQQVAIASQKIAQLFAGEIIAIAPEFYATTANTGNGINSVNINQNIKSDEKEQVNHEQLDMTNLKIKLTELTETLAETDFITDDSDDLDDDVEF